MALTLPDIYSATKRFVGSPTWVSDTDGKLRLSVPLDIDGIGFEGLLLRGWAITSLPDEQITLQLECGMPNRRDKAIDRIDWRPIHEHDNRGKGPVHLQMVKITGSHHHSFALNWLPSEERIRAGNLPIAEPIHSRPQGVKDLLVFVGEIFRIKALDAIGTPPWQRDLL